MVVPVPREMILAQVRAVASDIGVDAVKVGMLGDEPTIEAVAEALGLVEKAPVVVDPVMVAESGARAPGPEREGRADRAHPAAGDGGHPEPRRGALAGRGGGGSEPGRARRDGPGAWAARRSSSPAATPRTGQTPSTTATAACGSRARASRPVPPTAPGAPTRRRLPPSSRAARSSPTPPAGRRRSRREAVGDGLRGIGAGAGPGGRLRPGDGRARAGPLGQSDA